MVFCDAADQATLDALYALTPPQPPVGQFPPPGPHPKPLPAVPPFQAAGARTPDVLTLQIIVEAEAPVYDTGAPASMADANTPPSPGQLDGRFRVVYNWQVDFPALTTPVAVGAASPPSRSPSDLHRCRRSTPLCCPTPARRPSSPFLQDVTSASACAASAWTTPTISITETPRRAPVSPPTLESGTKPRRKRSIVASGSPDQQLQAYHLRDLDNSNQQDIVSSAVVNAITAGGGVWTDQAYQNLRFTSSTPPQTPLQLLASALRLPLTGQTLAAPSGQRIIFGAQNTLRHALTQDRSSITFSTQKDLINQWIVVTRRTLNRDWTWTGLAQGGPNRARLHLSG